MRPITGLLLSSSLLALIFNLEGCSESKTSKPKNPSSGSGYQYQTTPSSSVPPYSYQQSQMPPVYGQSGNYGQYNGGYDPGLYGGQSYNPNNSSFSLSSILGLLGQFLGLGNGISSPFSFLQANVPVNTTRAVQTGVALFSDQSCGSGITTVPAGQSVGYYQSLCQAYPGTLVSSVGLNGQCQKFTQAVKFEELCQVIIKAELTSN